MDKARELLARFKTRFGTSAAIYRAPGRLNLIGEHTDYNESKYTRLELQLRERMVCQNGAFAVVAFWRCRTQMDRREGAGFHGAGASCTSPSS